MIELDIGQFAPEVARILLLRGSGLPPLLWNEEPHRGAKKSLDDLADSRLFAPSPIPREDMAAAVRSLLYLWHGWVGDSLMYGQAVPDAERFYLTALCERQSQHPEESKAAFKQLRTHPIFEPLMVYALSVIPLTIDPPLQRVREMLQMDKHWEAYLFTDAWMGGVTGKVRPAGEAILRQLQCREFELLLTYCYEQATGQKIAQRRRLDSEEDVARRARERDRRSKEERRRREEKARRQQATAASDKTKEKSTDKEKASQPESEGVAKAPAAGLRIRCPKCSGQLMVSPALRGKSTRCGNCGAGFMVPSPDAVQTDVVGIICPKCQKRLNFPGSARGKKAQCIHCAAVFVVPQVKSPSSSTS